MKKKILTITLFAVVAAGSFLLGTTHAKTEVKTVEVERIVEVIPNGYIDTTTDDFFNNYVDMRTVVNFEASENGLQLYTNGGNGYYWER